MQRIEMELWAQWRSMLLCNHIFIWSLLSSWSPFKPRLFCTASVGTAAILSLLLLLLLSLCSRRCISPQHCAGIFCLHTGPNIFLKNIAADGVCMSDKLANCSDIWMLSPTHCAKPRPSAKRQRPGERRANSKTGIMSYSFCLWLTVTVCFWRLVKEKRIHFNPAGGFRGR